MPRASAAFRVLQRLKIFKNAKKSRYRARNIPRLIAAVSFSFLFFELRLSMAVWIIVKNEMMATFENIAMIIKFVMINSPVSFFGTNTSLPR